MKFITLLIFSLFLASCVQDTKQSKPEFINENKISPAIDTVYVEGQPEKINLHNRKFYFPQFSPDGNSLFLTSANYKGIWKYNFGDQSITQITDMASSGYDYDVSDTGDKVYFIAKDYDENRRSISKIYSAGDGSTKLIYEKTAPLSSIKISEENSLIFFENDSLKKINITNGNESLVNNLQSPVYKIDQSKIFKYDGSGRSLLKDYSPSNLIWLEKLPGNDKLAVYIVGKGLVIIDENGIENFIGNFSSPAISLDGKMIAYNIEKDDGHRILSSDIYVAVLGDSIRSYKITDTENEIEMNPSWSPKGDEIVFNNLNGEIKIVNLKFVK